MISVESTEEKNEIMFKSRVRMRKKRNLETGFEKNIQREASKQGMKRPRETDCIHSTDKEQEHNLSNPKVMKDKPKLHSEFMKYEKRQEARDRSKKMRDKECLAAKEMRLLKNIIRMGEDKDETN